MTERDDRIDDLLDEQLRYLRGEGPPPDLDGVSEPDRTKITELFEVVEALSDAQPASPSFEEDPVAIRLGLVPGPDSPPAPANPDPIQASLDDLAFRHPEGVRILSPDAGLGVDRLGHSFATCRSLLEIVQVVVVPADAEPPDVDDVRRVLIDNPDFSAVALTSADAQRAVVVTYSRSFDRVVPGLGWIESEALQWEPLGIALGRHFERSLPKWDEVARLGSTDVLEGGSDISNAIAQVLDGVAGSRPKLPHKQKARDFVSSLGHERFETWVDQIRQRELSGDDLVAQVTELCRAESP